MAARPTTGRELGEATCSDFEEREYALSALYTSMIITGRALALCLGMAVLWWLSTISGTWYH